MAKFIVIPVLVATFLCFVQGNPTAVCTPAEAPPEPSTGCCGTHDSGDRLLGGTVSALDQYPWLAVIEYTTPKNEVKLFCGGALISGRYVLTSAHCVTGFALKAGTPTNVRLGDYDISNDVKTKDCIEGPGGSRQCGDDVTVIPIETIIPHPEYSSKGPGPHDIALLRLKEIAPYTDAIRPICLPQSDVTLSPPQDDYTMVVAGWFPVKATQEKTSVKRHFSMRYRSREQCQPMYNVGKRNATLSSGQLCAAGQPGSEFCKVNLGGVLMNENPEYSELVGIISFGPTPCGVEDIPDVFAKVYDYKSWINSQIKA